MAFAPLGELEITVERFDDPDEDGRNTEHDIYIIIINFDASCKTDDGTQHNNGDVYEVGREGVFLVGEAV